MRYNYMIVALILLFLPTYALAQDINITINESYINSDITDGILIDGPESVAANTETRFTLINTPVVELSKPLLTQIDWLTGEKRIKLFLLAPGEPKELLNLKAELIFGENGATLQPYTIIHRVTEGYYRIILLENSQIQEHLFTVGDPIDPTPDPDPTDLSKNKQYQIMLLQDTDKLDNLSMEQVALLSGLKFRTELAARGHTFKGVYDVTNNMTYKTVCSNGQCIRYKATADIDNWVEWYKKSNLSLPVAVFWDGKSDSMIVKELPKDETSFWGLFK